MAETKLIVIDATDLIIGRLGTYAAKQALLGYDVKIINSEKAIASGKKKSVYDEYLQKMHRGTWSKGPFIHRMPDRILRRTIRGMLPHKKSRGIDAFKRVMCYVGCPDELKDKKAVTFEDANKSKLPSLNYIDLRNLSKRLGAKLE
jgi:large subunit ribosomal protein L13